MRLFFRKSSGKKKLGGFNTLDMSGVLLVIGLIIASIGGAMYSLMSGQKKDEVVNTMVTALDRTRTRMHNFPTRYASLDNSTCYQSNIFPASWKSETEDQFNTPLADNGLTCSYSDQAVDLTGVTTTGTGKFAKFTLTGATQSQCNEIAAGLLSKFEEVDVNGTRIDGNATLVAQCATGQDSGNSITLIGR